MDSSREDMAMTADKRRTEASKPQQRAVIVGYGHAGAIHGKAYDLLQNVCVLSAVVEPRADKHKEILSALPGVSVYRDLSEALEVLGSDCIVDFCVPAKINLEVVQTALRYGARKFLIEKPLSWDVASTRQLVSKLDGCEVVYLDTYAASRGIQELLKSIAEQDSPVKSVDIVFHKNRRPDSMLKRGFMHDAVPSAWMIEGPHMLSIARQIAGEIRAVSSASTFDMDIGGGQVLTDHGGGTASLDHEGGAVSSLELNLCSEFNYRRVEVRLANGVRLAIELPASKRLDQYSTLERCSPEGAVEVRRFEDRPMERCVQNGIRNLAGEATDVRRLSDGLSVCTVVEKMTARTKFWQSVPKQWKHFGPPLRPCPVDIGIMEDHVSRWMRESSATGCDVLLCGVTPEIVEMNWPPGTRLWAVERSLDMIGEVWPAKGSKTRQPLQAEWLKLPFGPGSFDIVIGDGCPTSLAYPGQQDVFVESVRTVLQPRGRLIMRFFVQSAHPESPEAVFEDLRAGRIGNFHVFKWRLAMSLQKHPEAGVRVDTIWSAWNDSRIVTDWPPHTVGTIDTYRGSDHVLTFTNLEQIRAQFARRFDERACIVPAYELGERCPTLVFAPR